MDKNENDKKDEESEISKDDQKEKEQLSSINFEEDEEAEEAQNQHFQLKQGGFHERHGNIIPRGPNIKKINTKDNFKLLGEKNINNMGLRADKKKHEVAVRDFWDQNEKVCDLQIPWGSIELIFNSKNIWINLQYPNPAFIMYELFDQSCWSPYLNSAREDGNEDPWLAKVGSFFYMNNLSPPHSVEEIRHFEETMLNKIQITINQKRSGINLETFWKPKEDKINQILDKYLRLLFTNDTMKEYPEVIVERSSKIVTEIKEMMPKNHLFKYLPLRFNIADTERVRSIVAENFSEFYLSAPSESFFATSCKMFPFPNKISSIRIIIAIIYKHEATGDVHESSESEEIGDEGWGENDNNILDNLIN